MLLIGCHGQVLDPRSLMPNPKVGTVTLDVKGAVEFRAGTAGIVHAGIGKVSLDEGKLVENIKTFVDAVAKAKPTSAKGISIQRIAFTSTMGPAMKVEPGSVLNV